MRAMIQRARSRSPLRRRRRAAELIDDIREWEQSRQEQPHERLIQEPPFPPQKRQQQQQSFQEVPASEPPVEELPPPPPQHESNNKAEEASPPSLPSSASSWSSLRREPPAHAEAPLLSPPRSCFEPPSESAAIEVVLETSPDRSHIKGKQQPFMRRRPGPLHQQPDPEEEEEQEEEEEEASSRMPLSPPMPPQPQQPLEPPMFTAFETTLEGTTPEQQPPHTRGGSSSVRARKHFKQKYMKENSHPNELLGEGTRRCFPFNHVNHHNRRLEGEDRPNKNYYASATTNTNTMPHVVIPPSPQSSRQSSERSVSRGRATSRGRANHPFRTKSSPKHGSTAPSSKSVASSSQINTINTTPPRRPTKQQLVVLSPYRRRSKGGSTQSSTSTTTQKTGGPHTAQHYANETVASTPSSTMRGNPSPSESPMATSTNKTPTNLWESPNYSWPFGKNNKQQQDPQHETTPKDTPESTVKLDNSDHGTKDEKKEAEDEFPSELLIPNKPSSNNPRSSMSSSNRVEMMRSKSVFSETSSLHSSVDLGGGTESNLQQILKSIESSLDLATQKGQRIDRQMVYQTLMDISQSLGDDQERQAMQKELTTLMRSRTGEDSQYTNNNTKRGGKVQGPGYDDDEEEEQDLATTIKPKMVRIVSPEKTRSEYLDDSRRSGEDDDSTMDSSYISKDDTITFLQEFFSLSHIFGTADNNNRAVAAVAKKEGDNWDEFMEEHGLKRPKRRDGVPMLRTYSEETGSDGSAFTSGRFSKESSYISGEQRSRYSSHRGGTVRSGETTSTATRSWWRHGGNNQRASRRDTWNRYHKTIDEKDEENEEGPQSLLKPRLSKTLPSPANVTGPREARRHRRATTVSPPPQRRFFRRNSKRRELLVQDNEEEDDILYGGEEEAASVAFSLSSIESEQYNEGGDRYSAHAEHKPRGDTFSRRNRRRSKSLDGRRSSRAAKF